MESFDLSAFSKSYDILRWKNGICTACSDAIAEEVRLPLYLDGELHCILTCSPWEYEELIVGYLFTDGSISSPDEIDSIRLEGSALFVERKMCSSWPTIPEAAHPALRLRADAIPRLVGMLQTSSVLFHHTGGVHNAALSDGEELLVMCEDVGRRNALDRLIGRCLLQKIPMEGRALVFSGRVPEEIIQKAVAVRFHAVLSVSAPTSMAVEIARESQILLAGFVRGDRFNVYSQPDRVIF